MWSTCLLASRRAHTMTAPYRAPIAAGVGVLVLVCCVWPVWLWLLSGIVSSIGFGGGVHTGLLFLLPYQAQVAAASPHTAFYDLLPATLLHGAGSALGEIPPFLLGDRVVTTMSESMQRGVRRVQPYVRAYGAWMIFAFGCSPSMFFDWCGVCAGMLNIPFYKFLAATMLGKMVKSTLLMATVVHAVQEKGGVLLESLPDPGGVPLWPLAYGVTLYMTWTVLQDLAREERRLRGQAS